ncbi:hypothetical protein TIFTF001_031007 [Ficus carica]|uniref:Uncharacterized protein n=1 Tax=Ficus carica TaxID=3494 RepID=A0AA88DW31_FICCA|nr:hypothetical protein TIFTF001_031007 [Ficus carica]
MPSSKRPDKYTEHPWPANVRPPGLDADNPTICHSRRTRIPDQILPSHQGERRTRLDCAPSTIPLKMYLGLAGLQASPTCYCNMSRRHPLPPTLTGAAPAGASDGHPTVSCTGTLADLSIGVPTADTDVPITSRCFPFAGNRWQSNRPDLIGPPNHIGCCCRRLFRHQH